MSKKKETPKTKEKKTQAKEKKTSSKEKKAASAKPNVNLENKNLIVQGFTERLQTILDEFNDAMKIETNLTGAERQRLVSARVRNNGFIDKAFDVAHDNPTFLPPHFDKTLLTWKMNSFQDLRQLMAIVDALQRSVSDAFIVQADDCFKDASRIYASLREQTRANIPGAKSLFELLEIYFKRRTRTNGEPTEKQVERDVKKLLTGKADGEIVIMNEAPKTTRGVHKVIDKVNKGRAAVIEDAQAEIKE